MEVRHKKPFLAAQHSTLALKLSSAQKHANTTRRSWPEYSSKLSSHIKSRFQEFFVGFLTMLARMYKLVDE